ncbi:MAG TPA: chemotaxis protein CheA, partial [Cycloclasticus sp.]|nr:chemotaxis protein CheA [Cycloclasticus sp.]
ECDLSIEAVVEQAEQADSAAETASTTQPVAATKAATKTKKVAEAASIRVGIDKVDEIINLVGELVITQSMLDQAGEDLEEQAEAQGDNKNAETLVRLRNGLVQLERNTRELQEGVMRIRMLPISFVFSRMPRLVHDLSSKLDKKVELLVAGEETELDKTVMENIGDPMVHLVRNALDHGIETPEIRLAAGKPETGTLKLNAFHKGSSIVIEIKDDGAGINKQKVLAKAIEKGVISADDPLSDDEINNLIFAPGFSTADVVSDVSGRGVGMDVVKTSISKLGGSVSVTSEEGKGSLFTIRLPLTLAILDGQLVTVGNESYVIPLIAIIESLQVDRANISVVAGKAEVYKLREHYIPIIRSRAVFGLADDNRDLHNSLMVVVEVDGSPAGIIVDDLQGQQQVVIKSLETNYRKVETMSGATILGDGTVALIWDVNGMVNVHKQKLNTDSVQA